LLHKLRRILDYLRSCRRDLRPVINAQSSTELLAVTQKFWWSGNSATGFNGQILRARIVYELYKTCQCTAFVETGTYLGSTAMAASQLTGGMVLSCELFLKYHLLARLRLLFFPNVRLTRADSRTFLKKVCSSNIAGELPFFYLDAHWYEDIPLQMELDLIQMRYKQYVIVVDDFKVPGRKFSFDKYSNSELSGECYPVLFNGSAEYRVFYPNYEPSEDTGSDRGYVIIVCGCDQAMEVAMKSFPLNLLIPHDPKNRE